MSFLFPYWMVKEHSRVGIYGFGEVGKNFFLQLKLFNYADCVLVTDKDFFDYKEIQYPFAASNKLAAVDLDFLIISVLDKEAAKEIRKEILEKYGENITEEKIVWSPYYNVTFNNWPHDKDKYLKAPSFFENIARQYFSIPSANWKFDRCGFYQSFSDIGINGVRNSQERLEIYHIRDFLTCDSRVLDIGCNCGFLDLQIAPFVKELMGIDIEPNFVDIARQTAGYVGIDNVNFRCASYADEEIEGKFDAVFSLAVHTNIFVSGLAENDYVKKIVRNVADNGYFFFESHNWRDDAERYRRLSGKFAASGFAPVLRRNYYSDFERRITVFRYGGR